MRRIRSRLTYANVMVTILAFLVLGGGTALGSYVISSNSQVGPGTISGHKPPTGKHANIIGGSVNGGDIADNSLGGADVNESSLGTVPNANALDGIGSKGFIQGNGRIVTIDTATPNSTVLFDLAGFVKVFGNCGGTASAGNYSVTTHDQPVTVLSDNGGANPALNQLSANSATGSGEWNTAPGGEWLTFSFQAAGGKVATASIFSYAFHNPVLHEDVCKYQGHMIVSGA